jgi:signal transduction histidine kinase
MIRSVLINLVTNAIKYSESGDTVQLGSVADGDHHIVHVKDDGVGMTRTQRMRLFRIDESSSTKGTANEPGAGLGLIICQELIELHGDEIAVESSPGKGSKFSFRLTAITSDPVDLPGSSAVDRVAIPREQPADQRLTAKSSGRS